jgi:hypothetical protein
VITRKIISLQTTNNKLHNEAMSLQDIYEKHKVEFVSLLDTITRLQNVDKGLNEKVDSLQETTIQ